MLRYLVQKRDCRWLSATNADNIYGSDIVKSVRLAESQPDPDFGGVADMVLTPLDSRNFPEQGKQLHLPTQTPSLLH